jgi:DNA-binding transcriptional LysR family regulator
MLSRLLMRLRYDELIVSSHRGCTMTIGQLEVLVAIAENGSLTEAAHTIGLTQSAVSHSLNRLETELGVTLVDRGRQGATLTRIGDDIVQHARQTLTQMDIIRQKAARARGLATGKLRFGAVPNIAGRLLTGIIRDFQMQYPRIDLILFEGSPPELMTWLDEGIIDIGTVILPDPYAHTVRLAHNEIRVMMAASHPLAGDDPAQSVDLESLRDDSLIGPKSVYRLIQQLPQLQQVTLPRLRYEVSNYSTIFAMVSENMGIALVPGQLMDMSHEAVITRSLDPALFLDVYLAGRVQSPAITLFMKEAAEWSKQHGFLPDKL